MKDRALWTFVALAVIAIAAAYWLRNKTPPPTLPPAPSTAAAPVIATPTITAPARVAPATVAASVPAITIPAANKPKPEVAIQDGKTIDFSSGVAVVKDDAKQKAVIDKSVKEMETAAQGVTFGPPASKPAEPAPAKP